MVAGFKPALLLGQPLSCGVGLEPEASIEKKILKQMQPVCPCDYGTCQENRNDQDDEAAANPRA
jgi:hypothetical protein